MITQMKYRREVSRPQWDMYFRSHSPSRGPRIANIRVRSVRIQTSAKNLKYRRHLREKQWTFWVSFVEMLYWMLRLASYRSGSRSSTLNILAPEFSDPVPSILEYGNLLRK